MRVARIIDRLPPASGGMQIHGAELSRHLRDLGVEQHVFCRVGARLAPDVAQSWLPGRRQADTRLHLALFCAWSPVAVARAHGRTPFDLVHVHGDFPEASAAAIASRALGIPSVMTVHGGLGRNRRQDALRRVALGRMRLIWAVSAQAAADIAGAGVAGRVVVRPSGVRAPFLRDRPEQERDGRTVIAVGRLDPVKGLEHLIAARDLLAGRRDLRWSVVAGGSGAYADDLRARIAARPDMSCREETDPALLADALRGAAAFVLPSVDARRMREGVPTALLEAIATGTPVVASDSGGIRAILRDGEDGLLVAPGDAAALAAAIERVLDDPDAARERARSALERRWAVGWGEVAREVADGYAAALAAAAR